MLCAMDEFIRSTCRAGQAHTDNSESASEFELQPPSSTWDCYTNNTILHLHEISLVPRLLLQREEKEPGTHCLSMSVADLGT